MQYDNLLFYLGIIIMNLIFMQFWYWICVMGVNKLSDLVCMI